MVMIRKSTNVRNSAWNLANIIIYPIVFLAATPFFIDQLSENTFGEWMLINSYVFIAVHLIGFGLPESIIAHVAEAIGNNNQKKLFAYINASARLLGRMSMLALAFAVLMVLSFLAGWFIFSEEIWKTLIIATFLIAFRFPDILFQNIFKGFEAYHLSGFFSMLYRLSTLVIQIVLVFSGYGLPEMFVAALVVQIIVSGFQGFIVFHRLKGFKPVLFRALPERKDIYQFGFWSWLQTVISLAAYQLDRFLVAWFLGTSTVAYYVLASTIANHLNMAFDAVVAWLLPKVSRLRQTIGDTRKYFHTIRAFSVGSSLLIIALLFFISEPLFTLWLGPDKYGKMIGFFRLFLVFESFLILAIVPKFYLNAIRSLPFNTSLELLTKSAILVGMIVLFSIYGTANSLIWGQIIALILIMPVIYFLINNRILRESPFKETVGTQLPSLAMIGLLLSNDWRWSAGFLFLSIACYWLIYKKDKNFQPELLTHE